MNVLTAIYEALLCLLEKIAGYLLLALVEAVNLIIVGAAAAITAVVTVLPSMPGFPEFDSPAWQWLNWATPASSLAALFTTLIGFIAAWFGIKVVLNWVRAL